MVLFRIEQERKEVRVAQFLPDRADSFEYVEFLDQCLKPAKFRVIQD